MDGATTPTRISGARIVGFGSLVVIFCSTAGGLAGKLLDVSSAQGIGPKGSLPVSALLGIPAGGMFGLCLFLVLAALSRQFLLQRAAVVLFGINLLLGGYLLWG